MKRLVLAGVATATVALFGSVTAVQASPITYTETATGTGHLGGTAFTNALVVITLLGDTATVIGSPGSFHDDFGSATVNVFGLGTAAFTDLMGAVDAPGATAGASAGISDFTVNQLVMFTVNPVFGTYDLRSSIGPITGPITFNPGSLFPTTLGNFDLTSVLGNTSTFAATTTSAVPEPATLTLTVLGLGGALTRYRRRRWTCRSPECCHR